MVVGIDISKRSFDVSWFEAGRATHEVFEYNDEGIEKLLAVTDTQSHYVMEATGIYHTNLALKLHQSGRQVSIVNPLVIKRFAQMQLTRVKSDKADAQLIRQYGEGNKLSCWKPSSAVVIELQQAHGWLDDLIRERTRLLNRQEAHTIRATPSEFVGQRMRAQKQHLNEQIKSCEEHLEVLVKKHFPELYRRLLSIPGIGKKTTIEFIIITDGFTRFDDVKALCTYVGVSPTTYNSGTSVKGRGSIAKMGQGRMRQLLYLCSWTAKTCNKACKELYARLRAAGKPAKVINIAIAHKLVRQAFAVVMKATDYSESYA